MSAARAATPRSIRLTVAPEPRLLGTVRLLVATTARRVGLDDEQVEDLKLAVSELCSAAVATGHGPIELRLTEHEDRLVVEIIDVTPAGGRRPVPPDEEEDRAFGLALVASLVRDLEDTDDERGGRVMRFWLPVGGQPSLHPL